MGIVAAVAAVVVGAVLWLKGGAPPQKPAEWHPPAESNTVFAIPEAERALSACYRAYSKLYAEPDLELVVSFGYKDARPARYVGDRYEKFALVNYLLQPCPPGQHACGFRRDEEDADLFFKTVYGPDKKPRQVKLRVFHSSVGPDDDENRRDSFQKWQTQYSERGFLKGLSAASVVLYNGHSRDGGGPDFLPPRLRPDKHANYYWYGQVKPGLVRMVRALKEPPSSLKMLGLYSCVSTKHFSEDIYGAKKNLALITSEELLYYTDALKNLMGSLSSILGLWCEPAFLSAIKAEKSGGSSRLQGFFE